MTCAVGIVALALGITATSCGEFVRNNPFDPAVPVKVTIEGPDSAFAQFDTLHFTLTTDPAYDYAGLVEWQIGGLQKIDNNGTYQVGPIATYSGQPTRVTVGVRIGTRTASKEVNVVFRPVGFSARFCQGDSLADSVSSFAATATVCTTVLDARGGVIATNPTDPLITARVLDTLVARIANDRVIVPTGNGSTRVVFSYKGSADTLSFTVRQQVARLTFTPAACYQGYNYQVPMNLGDTLRVKLGAPGYDSGDYVVTDPATVQAAAAQIVWEEVPRFGSVPISVTPDGLLTATNQGESTVRAYSTADPQRSTQAVCTVLVQ